MIRSRKLAHGLDTQSSLSHQQLWQTKLESRCHRSRQKPWKLLRNQKVAGRPRRPPLAGRPSQSGGRELLLRGSVPRLACTVSA